MTSFVLVGCDSSQDGNTVSASAPPAAPTSAPASATSSAPTEPAPASIRPSARDGKDYEACLGGDCEIAVSGPVKITLFDGPLDLKVGPLIVRKVSAGSVRVRMALPAGPSLEVTIKKGCTTAFQGNSASGLAHTSCSREPEDIVGSYFKQLVTVRDITDGTAILLLKYE